MKLYRSPSLYKYCISTRSIRACGNFSVGLKVFSTTPPLITFFNFVLTNAAPFPGLTCWNSIICTTLPSISSVRPFLKSPADIIMIFLLISSIGEKPQFFRCTLFYNTSGYFSTVFSLSLLFPIKIKDDFFQFSLQHDLNLLFWLNWCYQTIAYSGPFGSIVICKKLVSDKNRILQVGPHKFHGF